MFSSQMRLLSYVDGAKLLEKKAEREFWRKITTFEPRKRLECTYKVQMIDRRG
jgi:hypothetical protein